MQDPLFTARQMVAPAGQAPPALGVPVKLSHTPGAVRTAPAAFGENTDQILNELGYGEAEIKVLRGKGVI
jgi:crotonobetainyl-CoA:carnitine CoA-transferase CaiB-like acyl-CoA transferase